MICSSCGSALQAGTSFCANCGTPVAVAPAAPQPPVAPAPLYYGNPTPGYYAPVRTTSGLAIAGLILSLLYFTSLIGAIMGHVALSKINQSRGAIEGRGIAIAAIATGWAFTAINGLFLFFAIIAAVATSSYY